MSDDSRKRTVRAQVTNGALEAKAYVEPRSVAQSGEAHRTFKMQKVEVDKNLDPRMRKTVARGQGEQLAELEGDIVDPETGRVMPPVGADPNPKSPWKGGKRPTHVKLARPDLRTAGTAGVARSKDALPSRLVWVGAAAIVIAAVAIAVVVGTRASARAPEPTPTPRAPAAAPREPTEDVAPMPERAPASPTGEATGAPTGVAPDAKPSETPGAVAAPPSAPPAPNPPATPSGTGSARKGGRIF